ncbi:MAG TPA: MGMT family protein [Candidatus Nanoarchaeia archaeon]|nr:MGMT family protein [Candidatus Nanoarchaeia archaeon]
MNTFYEKIYSKLRQVPKGRVTTYKDLAHAVRSKAYRAVGTAMNKNPYGYLISSEAIRNRRSKIRGDSKRNSGFFLVPCHRVINSDGKIGGFASGTCNKIKMLKTEGIVIESGKIDLKKYGFKF